MRRPGGRRGWPIKRLTLLAALLLLTALSIRPGDRSLYAPPIADGVTVYVLSNPYHTDVAVPSAALASLGGPTDAAARQLGAFPYTVVGWGDASFYEGSGFSLARALDGLRALFAPGNPSIVHLYGVGRRPDQAFGPREARPLVLSHAGFDHMVRRIDRSFAITAGQPPKPSIARPGELFFPSTEHFSILKICNHWTADLLNAAGLRMLLILDTAPQGLLLDISLDR